MKQFHRSASLLSGALALGFLFSSAPAANAQSAKTIQAVVEALRAGGKTIAGPGVYTRQPTTSDAAVQLTVDTNVCGTITLISGDGAEMDLLDGAAVNLQGFIANATLKTAAGCADGVRNVQLQCTGAVPCVAVWRVDAK
ncbi:MAG TPA: hypothetical protein VN634_18880 [Candidatus Limnocylindrales bacterium]|nr:hypothetical protein [Candidatus Limnocylindrales bacterium]